MHSPLRLRPRSGFTLVEIMVVVVIIGLLAAIGVPAFLKARDRSNASRYANDFRQFESAFQRYAMENGQLPQAFAAAGTVPVGMSGYLPEGYTKATAMGGNYIWSGASGWIALVNTRAGDGIMQQVDQALDDGDLSTGNFRKVGFTAYALHLD